MGGVGQSRSRRPSSGPYNASSRAISRRRWTTKRSGSLRLPGGSAVLFAVCPYRSEDIYNIYPENFGGEFRLRHILQVRGDNEQQTPYHRRRVAGGASAAARARRLCEDCEIIVFERGPHVSFANCGLPYFVGGEIAEQDGLLVQTPESLRARFNLDVRINTEVVRIDRAARRIQVRESEPAVNTRKPTTR